MKGIDPSGADPEIEGIAERLRAERPRPTGLQLDRAMVSAWDRAHGGRTAHTTRKGAQMKLRLAVTLVLALGMFFTGAGAALGVVEVAQNTALEEQYPPNDSKGPRKETISSTSSAPGDAKSSDQENAASDPEELAFTGFLAVPVLVGGIALLGGGLAMRRRL
jgi:hypothetical protein